MTAHALYRFHDRRGELLYVGITSDPGRRWPQHRADKPWWTEVARVDVETHPDRAAARAAEVRAIRNERPRYNIAGAVPVADESPRYRVRCEKCPARATSFSVLTAEIVAYRKERRRLDDPNVLAHEMLMTDLEDVSEPAYWYITCDEHYPGDDVVNYWGRVKSTRAGSVESIRHLGEKSWVGQDTDLATLAVALLAPAEADGPRTSFA